MTREVSDRVANLSILSPAAVKTEWQQIFGEAAPQVPISLLRLSLAHHLQQERLGSLPPSALRMLDALMSDGEVDVCEPEIRLKPGTRLLREWNGHVHAVMVTDEGFTYADRHYGSLSHIARAITKAHWSGPRFFGLRRPSRPPSRKPQMKGLAQEQNHGAA
ncbi:DUF2924 domain-containing protein [Aquisediminimonas sediminicola]|uniref:DUF2924 domain-containing protein n=1 Tax=Alteraquisediminimonas sediminicola TaxID=2676787 RepID=UPI001C8DFB41|nr:DUF2924 domain-containing protein [Aquisediminimonas sediminicola]